MSDLVENPVDPFSHNEAQIIYVIIVYDYAVELLNLTFSVLILLQNSYFRRNFQESYTLKTNICQSLILYKVKDIIIIIWLLLPSDLNDISPQASATESFEDVR